MKKQIKWSLSLAIAAAAVLLETTTAFCAAQWQDDNGQWRYLGDNGQYLTDTWQKYNNNYYYLDEEGVMAVNQLIQTGDGYSYVDGNGVRVVNQWVLGENYMSVPAVPIWTYIGPDGESVSGKKNINGLTYIFDDDGNMLTGWQLYSDGRGEDLYYLGGENEGYAHTGWQYLEPSEDMIVDEGPYFYDSKEWFYFSPKNAKAYRSTVKKIDGLYYEFDANGVMLEGWQGGSGAEDDPIRYYNYGTGERIRGWAWVPAPDDPEGDRHFYHFDKNGRPFNVETQEEGGEGNEYTAIGQQDGEQSGMALLSTNSRVYLFNDQGQMQTGLFQLTDVPFRDTTCTGVYYFEGENEVTVGERQSGERTITQEEEKYHFHFRSDGSAYENWIKDGKLYGPGGYRVESESGYMTHTLEQETRIEALDNPSLPSGTTVIVNGSGDIVKDKKVTVDGSTWIVKGYVATPE